MLLFFTGMLYILESSKYLEFISLKWKESYYDKFSVTSTKKAISEVPGRFCANSNSEKSDPKILSGRPCLESRHSSVSNVRPDDLAIPSGRPSVSRSFKQFKFPYVQMSWQHVRTLFRVPEESSIQVHSSRRHGNTVQMPVDV